MVNKIYIKGNFSSLLKRCKNGNRNMYKDKDLSIGVGGYDLLFEVCYMGTPILHVYSVNDISVVSDVVSRDVLRDYIDIIRKEYFK